MRVHGVQDLSWDQCQFESRCVPPCMVRQDLFDWGIVSSETQTLGIISFLWFGLKFKDGTNDNYVCCWDTDRTYHYVRSAAETPRTFAVSDELERCPLSQRGRTFLSDSTADICPGSAADICAVAAADICLNVSSTDTVLFQQRTSVLSQHLGPDIAPRSSRHLSCLNQMWFEIAQDICLLWGDIAVGTKMPWSPFHTQGAQNGIDCCSADNCSVALTVESKQQPSALSQTDALLQYTRKLFDSDWCHIPPSPNMTCF